jgi:hypothetical protein
VLVRCREISFRKISIHRIEFRRLQFAEYRLAEYRFTKPSFSESTFSNFDPWIINLPIPIPLNVASHRPLIDLRFCRYCSTGFNLVKSNFAEFHFANSSLAESTLHVDKISRPNWNWSDSMKRLSAKPNLTNSGFISKLRRTVL